MALTFTIGGISYLGAIDFKSIATDNSMEVAADSFEFSLTIIGNSFPKPKSGKEVIFSDGATREFGGVLTKVTSMRGPDGVTIFYVCECQDYVYYLNRRKVNNSYVSQAAGSMMKAILTDLFNESDNDTHYEFFKDNVTLIDDGPTISSITFDREDPSAAFDIIAQATFMQWWIDYDKKINLKAINSVETTFLIDNTLDIDDDIVHHQDYEETEDITSTASQIILRDVKTRSTANNLDEFKGSEGKSHNGNDNKIFTLTRTPFTFLDVLHVKKNTVTQTIKIEDLDGTLTGSEGGATDVFLRVREGESTVRFSNANVVADGDDIEISYKFALVDDSEDIDSACRDDLKERTGGDGIHQFIYTQASGLVVTDLNDLDRIEEILAAHKCKVRVRGQFVSWTKGWRAGQTFKRVWNQIGVEEHMWVLNVGKRVLTPADDPSLSDNLIESDIIFANSPFTQIS